MNLFAIGVTLLIIFMLILVLRSLFSTSRNKSSGFYQASYEDRPHDSFDIIPGEHTTTSHDRGDWGGRDMSHGHHDFGDSSHSGDGGDGGGGDSGGGDAGSGEGGGN